MVYNDVLTLKKGIKMENENVNEIVEVEEEVVEKKIPKGVIIAGLTAAGVGIACGVKWLVGKLRDSNIDYCNIDDDDIIEIDDVVEISIEED